MPEGSGSHEVRGSTPLCSTINDTAANESWWPFSYTPQGSNPARGRQPSGLSSEEGGARHTETRPEGADRRPPYAPPLIQRLPFGRRFCCRCEALRHRTLPFSGSAAAQEGQPCTRFKTIFATARLLGVKFQKVCSERSFIACTSLAYGTRPTRSRRRIPRAPRRPGRCRLARLRAARQRRRR